MAKSDYERWLPATEEVARDDNPLNVPYHVALLEAAGLADYVARYWVGSGDRPGLSRIKKRLPEETPETIRSLIRATQEAQTRLLLLADPAIADLGERARLVANELESAIEYTLDDGVQDEADEKFEQLRAFHSQDGERSAELAQLLRDLAALATELEDRIAEDDSDFDPKLITEARALADRLATAAPTAPERVAAAQKTREASRVRNRLLHLLTRQMGNVRKGAARVFAHHPELVREATSAYERRRRAEARRKKNEPTPAS